MHVGRIRYGVSLRGLAEDGGVGARARREAVAGSKPSGAPSIGRTLSARLLRAVATFM